MGQGSKTDWHPGFLVQLSDYRQPPQGGTSIHAKSMALAFHLSPDWRPYGRRDKRALPTNRRPLQRESKGTSCNPRPRSRIAAQQSALRLQRQSEARRNWSPHPVPYGDCADSLFRGTTSLSKAIAPPGRSRRLHHGLVADQSAYRIASSPLDLSRAAKRRQPRSGWSP